MRRLLFKTTPQQLKENAQTTLSACKSQLDSIVQAPATFESVMAPYARMENQLISANNILPFYQYVSPDAELRSISEQISNELSAFHIEASKRVDVYQRIKEVYEKNEKLEPQDRRYLEKIYLELKKAGLDLSDQQREQLTELEKELTSVCIKFHANLGQDTSFLLFSEDELAGVPEIDFEQVEGKYKVTFKVTDYDRIMRWCTNEETRKKMFVAYENRCPENGPLFVKALQLRKDISKLLGYKTFAHNILETRMAKTPENVESFLKNLISKAKPFAEKEKAGFLKIKQEFDPSASEVYAWDSTFLQNKVVERSYQVDQEAISEYFEINNTIKGMFGIFEKLMNLEFRLIELSEDEKWHPEVECYEIYQEGGFKGHLYLDSYPRENKYGHFANFGLRPGHVDSETHYPASALVCNFPRPRKDRPALLYHRDVVIFFHELGHGIHATLGLCKYARFSGTSVQHDFVETPSQLLENWTWDKEQLRQLGKHYKTGEPMRDELLDQLVQSKDANQGTFLVRQLFFGLFDYKAHTEDNFDPHSEWKKLRDEIIGLPTTEELRGYNQFGHLMGGYECGYYGYMWSLVYSADIWDSKFADAPLDAKTGTEYRDGILAKGYSEEANVLLERLLGRPPNSDAFMKMVGLVSTSAAKL